jgi:hypothetical protein
VHDRLTLTTSTSRTSSCITACFGPVGTSRCSRACRVTGQARQPLSVVVVLVVVMAHVLNMAISITIIIITVVVITTAIDRLILYVVVIVIFARPRSSQLWPSIALLTWSLSTAQSSI